MTTNHTLTVKLLRMISIIVLASACAMARYIPPTEQAPLRRDLVPIDLESMSQLSRQLTSLCSSLDPEETEHQRAAAQLLAMARLLDPVNRNVDELSDAFTFEKKPNMPPQPEREAAMNAAWLAQAWLAHKDAGEDGQTLANCLGDALAQLAPDRKEAVAFSSEQGKWQGWVASANEFSKAMPTEPTITKIDPETSPREIDHPQRTPSGEIAFALQSASVKSPLWLYNEEKKSWSLSIATVNLETDTGEDWQPFHFRLDNGDRERMSPILSRIKDSIAPLLDEKYKGLPKNGVIGLSIQGTEIYSINRNNMGISAAAAVLASAALSGDEPTGIVMGIVGDDGKLSLPQNSWELITFLDTTPSSRIVLPKAAAELLPSFLAMDNLAIFMKHDILLADNIDELIRFSKKSPDPVVAEALANFASIRQKATNTLGPFVTNPFVSKRLEAIATALPAYASAQYLLIQAKGQRPRVVSDKVIAQEIRRAMVPLWPITEKYEFWSLKDLNTAQIDNAHDESRKILDPLEKLVPTSIRSHFDTAKNLSNTARTLARASKKIHERGFGEGYIAGYHDKTAKESIDLLRNDLPILEQNIASILGESKPEKKKADN